MQIKIRAKGIDLTDAIQDYVEKKISGLDKFYDKIMLADVLVGKESQHHLKGEFFICECKLDVPGNTLIVSKNEKDLYKAIDKVRDHLEAELKKHKVMQREKDKKDKREVRANKEYQA